MRGGCCVDGKTWIMEIFLLSKKKRIRLNHIRLLFIEKEKKTNVAFILIVHDDIMMLMMT